MDPFLSPHPSWQMAVFPLVLGWQTEYWSLPLYFPDLVVGVLEGQPADTGLRSVPLPPLKESLPLDWRSYRPGELQQWKAYLNFKAAEEVSAEEDEINLIRAIKGEPGGDRPGQQDIGPGLVVPGLPDASMIWTLAWQLEKMLAAQEAGLKAIHHHQAQLDTWLGPDPWEEEVGFRPSPLHDPVLDSIDPQDAELANLRLYFWQAVMGPHLSYPWAPLVIAVPYLPGLSERRGAPRDRYTLPGCQDREGLGRARRQLAAAGLEDNFGQALAEVLGAMAHDHSEVEAAQKRLQVLIEQQLWPTLRTGEGQPSITLEIFGSSVRDRSPSDPIQEVFPGPILYWRLNAVSTPSPK